jgi:hypothetical protein
MTDRPTLHIQYTVLKDSKRLINEAADCNLTNTENILII